MRSGVGWCPIDEVLAITVAATRCTLMLQLQCQWCDFVQRNQATVALQLHNRQKIQKIMSQTCVRQQPFIVQARRGS